MNVQIHTPAFGTHRGPLHEDVVDYFLVREILPITKFPERMLWEPNPGWYAEIYIRSRMNDYWLREAYLAFPEKVKAYDWAYVRALTAGHQ